MLIMDQVVNDVFTSLYGPREDLPPIQVRVFGLSESARMRDLDPSNIDQLVSIRGMVIRSTHVVPDLKQVRWGLSCTMYCAVCCVLCAVLCAVYCVLCAVCGVRCAVCGVLCAVCCVLCAVLLLCCVLGAGCCVVCAVCCVLCAVCGVCCVLCAG